MDPSRTLRDILSFAMEGDKDACREACLDLAGWLAHGGSLPGPLTELHVLDWLVREAPGLRQVVASE